MRRAIPWFLGAMLAYLAIGSLLHYVMFPEPDPPPEVYPKVSDTWSSEWEGVEQRVLDQAPDQLLMEVRLRPGAVGPPEHIHTLFDEDFHIHSGTLTLVVDGERRVVGPGQSVVVPAGTPHAIANEGDQAAVSRHWRSPDHALFLSQMYAFTNEKEENRRPPRVLLQLSLFRPDTYLAAAPIPLQRAMLSVLAPTARLLGYRSYYERYTPRRR